MAPCRHIRLLSAAVAAVALLVSGCSSDEYVAPPSKVRSSDVADPAAASATLAGLQRAVRAGETDTAASFGADDGTDLLAAVTTNARRLRLGDVSFTYVTETGQTSGAQRWSALVAVTWRLRGYDEASARTEVPFSFADGGRSITAIGGSADRLPLWLSGPLDVRRAQGAVVMTAGSGKTARSYQRRVARAVVQTRRVLGGSGRLVVEVPGDEAGLERALDVDDGTYSAIAAITAPVDGSLTPRSPVHVFVNRAIYDNLDPVAAQVVMTHEATHALTGASLARGAPLWLVEGMADYVALRDVGLPTSTTAGQLIKQVRKQGAPKDLPDDAEFDTAATHLGTVYEAAWQVTMTLADRGGEAALIDFYRSVLRGTSRPGDELAQALKQYFDWSVADLTRAWRARLADLA
ncbi:MAG: basic secretory family protein [Nocardioidaceae bacterium]|nr:basic secretory family protein [Nocardioidaceae bacterium]